MHIYMYYTYIYMCIHSFLYVYFVHILNPVGPLSITVYTQIALKLFLTGSSNVVSCNPPAPPAV